MSLLSYGTIPLVLGPLYYTLPQLISDPVGTLFAALVPLALAQALSLVLAPPPPPSTSDDTKAGTSERSQKANGKAPAPKRTVGGGSTKHGAEDGSAGIAGRIVPTILSLILSTTYATPALLIGLVLFGAPVTTHHLHTTLTAAHLALLATPPLFYAHGMSAGTWRRVLSLDMPIDEHYGAALGTLVGAWLGAVPIPLDWDREWQRWPVTIVVGAYGGWAVGKMLGGTVARGRRIDLSA